MTNHNEMIWSKDNNPYEEAKITQQIFELFISFPTRSESGGAWVYFLLPNPTTSILLHVDKWIKEWYSSLIMHMIWPQEFLMKIMLFLE